MSDDDGHWSEGVAIGPPSIGWVVHEVANERAGDPLVWAWCKVDVAAPGYEEISFTKPDGHSAATDPTRPGKELRLGPVLFKLWC